VIPGEFDYRRPGSVKEAIGLLAEQPDAKLLAGGMSLIPALKHRLLEPDLVVDIGGLAELQSASERRGRIVLGARVTHAALAAEPPAGAEILGEVARSIGDVQVRNRGTIGGSLVHADPAADWPAAFLALGGEARVVGPRGERTIAAPDFFRGVLQSALEPDEILTAVRLEVLHKRAGAAYEKMRQAASGFAVVGVAVQLATDRRGRIDQIALAITGVNPVPFRAQSLEASLMGRTLDEVTELAPIDELDPMEDIHASADYRRALASVYARRALERAYAKAVA
jgi:carbon-monoxide dehydrogenase medium subunit